MTQRKTAFSVQPRHLVLLGLVALAFYVLLPQLGGFRSSWQLLRHPDPLFTVLAIALTSCTYLAATGTYCFLAFKSLPFGRTLLVQLAAMFVNRLLPAGIGALGVNYLYLRQAKHTASQAVSVVGINNLLGVIGHGLVVLVAILTVSGSSLPILPMRTDDGLRHFVEALAVLLFALAILGLVLGRRKVVSAIKDVKAQLSDYRHRPSSLAGALCTSVILTSCNVLTLLCCAHALGLSLPFVTVLLVFTFGVSAGAAVPTPGGLGGFEAGLAAGFVAYGISPSLALAAALLYRLISYWLPLLAGMLAFIVCQKRNFFTAA